jgi:hypothetical protein
MLQNKLDIFTNSTLIMCVKARSFANSPMLKLACHLELSINDNPSYDMCANFFLGSLC